MPNEIIISGRLLDNFSLNYLLNEYGDYKNDDVDGVMFKLFKVEE